MPDPITREQLIERQLQIISSLQDAITNRLAEKPYIPSEPQFKCLEMAIEVLHRLEDCNQLLVESSRQYGFVSEDGFTG